MTEVDLNVDIGEGFPYDEALLEFATSANICCGEHAGSWELTQATVELCKSKNIRIGCHPGFPDREHMGRRTPTPEEFEDYRKSIAKQMQAFYQLTPTAYTKPHGALYNMVCMKPSGDKRLPLDAARLIDTLVIQTVFIQQPIAFMLLPNFLMSAAAHALEIKVINEGFADRRYNSDGSLVPRTEPDAVLNDTDEISRQVLELAPKVDSICLHGDTPNCLEFAELISKTLKDVGYEIGY